MPEIRFHDLRHTAATIMLLRGVPVFTVSKVLGHSKPSVTLDIYGHLIPGAHEVAAQVMEEALTPVAIQVRQKTPADGRSTDCTQLHQRGNNCTRFYAQKGISELLSRRCCATL